MAKKEISYSSNPFDQWRLSQSGGKITIKPNGKAVFQFDSQDQYQRYLNLNAQRNRVS